MPPRGGKKGGGGMLNAVSSSFGGMRRQSSDPAREIAAWFSKYEDPDTPGVMNEVGIGKLGEDLGIDPNTDVIILVLMWRLGAKLPGQLTKEEFESGLEELGVVTLERLKEKLPELDPGFMVHETFREFYRFVFNFSLEGTYKSIEKSVVVALLPLVMATRGTHVKPFIDFLEQSSHTRITLDQWTSFADFTRFADETLREDLTKYDENSHWPTLIDEYVEYRTKNG